MASIRFATFNSSLNRNSAGELIGDLSAPDDEQAQAIAQIIQIVNPDVLLINEFDFDPDGIAQTLFQDNYLSTAYSLPTGEETTPVEYPFFYLAPSNTGIASGFDLDNNGEIVTTPDSPGYGNDAFGFGNFPGQFGMLLLSKFPIIDDQVRTFQDFLWQDMPGALLPDNQETPAPNDWYSPEELDVFRLASKSFWDVPIDVDGETIHVLASHPTPPVFDGPEDRNGPVLIGTEGQVLPTQIIAPDGIDFWESLEGMLVTVSDAVAVSPTTRFNEIYALADNGLGATGVNSRGGIVASASEAIPPMTLTQNGLKSNWIGTCYLILTSLR